MVLRQEEAASILLQFVQGSAGLDWAKKRNGWDDDSGTDVCKWDGVICNSRNAVTEINIDDSGLVAIIPDSLAEITSLRYLFLAENKLYGTIPPSIGTLPNLVAIDLYSNALRGPIPKMNNPNLEVIIFSQNLFSGLPADFGIGLDKLRTFDVSNNFIDVTLPESVGSMVELRQMNLSNNKFYGPIPESLGDLINLEGFFLSRNNFSGTIPRSFTRDSLPVHTIFLHNNRLSGTVPVALADLPKLRTLFIEGNKFTGTIPEELCSKNLNRRFFADNLVRASTNGVIGNDESLYDDLNMADHDGRRLQEKVNAEPEKLKNRGGSRNRSLESESCQFIACPPGYRSAEGGQRNGVFPCIMCEHNHVNPYIGSDKCYSLNYEEVLREFYYSTDGENWAGGGGDTWLNKNFHVCEKKGILCDSAGSIVEIRLPKMNLSGTIPEGLGFLRHLKVLDLSDNSLYGNLPSELRFMPLEVLDVSGNLLSGFIPPELCQTSGINGNGNNGDLNCNMIACSVGTYSETGRAEADTGQCLPCENNQVLGSKSCLSPVRSDYGGHSRGYTTSVYMFFIAMGMVIICFLFKAKERKTYNIDELIYEDDSDDSIGKDTYVDEPKSSPEDDTRLEWKTNDVRTADDWKKVPKVDDSQKQRRPSKTTNDVWLDVPKIV